MTEKLIADINKASEEYYELSQELAEIAERKGTAWLEIKRGDTDYTHRENVSNAEADKIWDATADGKRESYLKIYLKGLEKLRGARILEWKANNGTL